MRPPVYRLQVLPFVKQLWPLREPELKGSIFYLQSLLTAQWNVQKLSDKSKQFVPAFEGAHKSMGNMIPLLFGEPSNELGAVRLNVEQQLYIRGDDFTKESTVYLDPPISENQ